MSITLMNTGLPVRNNIQTNCPPPGGLSGANFYHIGDLAQEATGIPMSGVLDSRYRVGASGGWARPGSNMTP